MGKQIKSRTISPKPISKVKFETKEKDESRNDLIPKARGVPPPRTRGAPPPKARGIPPSKVRGTPLSRARGIPPPKIKHNHFNLPKFKKTPKSIYTINKQMKSLLVNKFIMITVGQYTFEKT